MSIERSKRTFRNYLIAKDNQFRIIFSTLIFFLGVIVVVVSLALSPLVFAMLTSDSMDVQHQAAQNFLVVIKWLIPTVLVLSALIFIHQLIVTHRIYGPMFNFSKVFKKISQGDLSQKVFIRRRDYLRNECNNINAMIAGLSSIISRIQTSHDHLLTVLENHAARIGDTESPDDLRASIEAVRAEARLVRDELSVFKLAPSTRKSEVACKPKDQVDY